MESCGVGEEQHLRFTAYDQRAASNEGSSSETPCRPRFEPKCRECATVLLADSGGSTRGFGPANDVRIDCKAAKHSDGDRGTPPADLERRTAGGVPPVERSEERRVGKECR